MCLILGMNVDIAPVIDEDELSILEHGVELKAKHCQVLETHDKHILMGTSTSLSLSGVKMEAICS